MWWPGTPESPARGLCALGWNGIARAGCRAHVRRKIVDAEKTAPEMAREAIAMVRSLDAVERQVRNSSVEERLRTRQEQSAPLLAVLRDKFLAWKEQLGLAHN
ncbi:MAG: IS66 family transposase [Terracidiphilus sp.]